MSFIVSFTTFGPRVENSVEMIKSLDNQTFKDFKIVMTLYKDDVQHIGPKMKALIDSGKVELIVADKNLGSHLKYFYAIKKYGYIPIITVDDDRNYDPKTLEYLIQGHQALLQCGKKGIVCNWGTRMWSSINHVPPMTTWPLLNLGELSMFGMAEGFQGILYPANCFSDLDKYLPLIEKIPHDDDLVLKAIGVKEKIPVLRSVKPLKDPKQEDIPEMMQYNMHNNENTWEKRNKYVEFLNPYFMEAFK